MTVPILLALERKPQARMVVAGLNSIAAWLMVYGLIAVFLCSKHVKDPRWRYLSDSAYWIYMAHPVALVMIEIPLMRVPLHPLVKFVAGILFAVPVLLWAYDRWVRPTWVGVLLNGRRYDPYGAMADRALSTDSAAMQAVSARRI
jgi:hypothetical protein